MNKAVFETALSQIMRQNQEDAPRPRTRSGLLDTQRLPFYKTTDKLFKKRSEVKKGKNYFISILMDASGSMHGSKRITPCLNAVKLLSESLENIVGIKFEIVGFNAVEIKYKDYNEKYDAKKLESMYYEQCCTDKSYSGYTNVRFATVINERTNELFIGLEEQVNEYLKKNSDCTYLMDNIIPSENHDGMAVWNSYLRSKERDGRKVLLVFSDGEPTFNYAVENVFQTRKVISVNGDKKLAKVMEQAHNTSQELRNYNFAEQLLRDVSHLSKRESIDIIGIGIQSAEVRKFYPHWGVVKSTAEIYNETIKQLSKVFIKD